MRPNQLPIPMVVYGTMTGNYSGKCLSFLAAVPLTIIPMKSSAFTLESGNTMSSFDDRRAKDESPELFQIFSKLVGINGLGRLWASPSNLIVQGDLACFDVIATKIRAVMQEVLGEIDFREVPHNEARPLFFEFKACA